MVAAIGPVEGVRRRTGQLRSGVGVSSGWGLLDWEWLGKDEKRPKKEQRKNKRREDKTEERENSYRQGTSGE